MGKFPYIFTFYSLGIVGSNLNTTLFFSKRLTNITTLFLLSNVNFSLVECGRN